VFWWRVPKSAVVERGQDKDTGGKDRRRYRHPECV